MQLSSILVHCRPPKSIWALALGAALGTAAVIGCNKKDPSGPSASEPSANAAAPTGAAHKGSAPKRSAGQLASAAARQDRYEARSPTELIPVGTKQRVDFAITPGDGLKINTEYPWKIDFEDVEGVELAQKTVADDQIELTKARATIPVYLEANTSGSHRIQATGRFSVCNDTKCWRINDQPLAFHLEASDVDPASAPGQD